MKKGSRSWHRSDRQQTAAESDSQGCNVTIDHVLMALILLVFIVFFDDFKSMVFLDRHPLPEHGYKLQKKLEGSSVSPPVAPKLRDSPSSSSTVNTLTHVPEDNHEKQLMDHSISIAWRSPPMTSISTSSSSYSTSSSSINALRCEDPVKSTLRNHCR